MDAHPDQSSLLLTSPVMEHPAMDPENFEEEMPFDLERLAYGGFQSIVSYEEWGTKPIESQISPCYDTTNDVDLAVQDTRPVFSTTTEIYHLLRVSTEPISSMHTEST